MRHGALILGLLFIGAAGDAPPTDERLAKIEERKKVLEAELARLRGEEKGLLVQVEQLTLGVRLKGEELRETEIVLQKANADMDQTLSRVRTLEKSVAATRPVLAARARDLYKLGSLSYLRLLLSVDHPSDFFSGYRFVAALARRDNERIAGLRRDLDALAATKNDLEKKTREALSVRAESEKARRDFEEERKRKAELLTSIVEKKELHAAYVHELEDAEGRLRSLLSGLGEGDVTVPLPAFKGSLPWPVQGRIKVPFGKRKSSRFETYTIENGVEIEAPPDSAVEAVHDGTVVFADRFQGYGLLVVLDHGGRHYTLYGHLGEVAVQTGEHVSGGGVLGKTGGEPGSSLYFEIRFQEQPEDPSEWLKKGEARAAEH